MKKIRYINYLEPWKRINTEEASVYKWDIWNKVPRKPNSKKIEQGKLTSKELAEYNHNHDLAYEFCIFDEEYSTDYPYCYCTVVPRNNHFGVNFIDYSGRKYLYYSFRTSEKYLDKLFLQEIWYYKFSDDEGEEQEYRIHFAFDEEGGYAARKYIDSQNRIEDYKGNRTLDVSSLYEDYPKFGHYESITRLNRPLLSKVTDDFGENELSDKIQNAPYKSHQGKTYTQEEWEAYEQEQWNKHNKNKE